MSTSRLHPDHHPSTSAQFVAGLTDFGPGRSKLFWQTAPTSTLKVPSPWVPRTPDVTEGSGGHLGNALHLTELVRSQPASS